ncbi:MAG: hypothetical protein V1765_00835 [bacterium]
MFVVDWLLVHQIWSSVIILALGALWSSILLYKNPKYDDDIPYLIGVYFAFLCFIPSLLFKPQNNDLRTFGVLWVGITVTLLIAVLLFTWLPLAAGIWVAWSALSSFGYYLYEKYGNK